MKRAFARAIVPLAIAIGVLTLGGCGQGEASYSSDVSKETPKPRDNSPDFSEMNKDMIIERGKPPK